MGKLRHRILVVATSRNTRGGITSVVKSHEKGDFWTLYRIKWVETHIDRGIIWKLFYFCRAFIQFLCYIPFADIIHIHLSTTVSLYRKSIFFLVAKICQKKIIIHFHSSVPEVLYMKQNKFLYRYLFRNSEYVLVLSNQWKKWVLDALGDIPNIKVLYNPVVLENSKLNTTQVKKKKQILFAGSIIDRKGYKDLIRAFSLVSEKYQDWNLVFAGNGEIDKGLALVNELNLSGRVFFKGWVSGNEKQLLFAESSIFCLTSYSEGFPMAVLDAWAYCLPVICTPVGGLPDFVIDKENAVVYPVGDIEALASALDLLIDNPSLRESISISAKKMSDEVFHLDIINSQISKLYEELLSK